jgi:membrane-associated phospholipid phosphatase
MDGSANSKIMKHRPAIALAHPKQDAQASSWNYSKILNDNLPLVAIVVIYIVTIYCINSVFGIHDKLRLSFYNDWFARILVVFSGLFILSHFPGEAYRKYFNLRTLAGVLTVFLLASPFNSAFVSFKQTIPLINPFMWDARLMQLDHLLHLQHHAWQCINILLNYPWLIRIIDRSYMAWFVFLFAACLWMAWTKRRHLRRCFLISALLTWILLGSGLATVFSSVGPCFYSRVVKEADNPFAPLMTRLSQIHRTTPLWAVENQEALWEAYEGGQWLPFGGISAMPSIHLAIATLYALLAFNIRRWLGYIFWSYLLLMQIGSVILGWHYAVDGYTGTALALAIWCFVKKICSRLDQQSNSATA